MLKNSDIYANEITKNEILNGITEDRANQLFNNKLSHFENIIKKDVKVNLHQYEFDALVSLVYNTGRLYPHLLQNLNSSSSFDIIQKEKSYRRAAKEFENITNGGEAGLVKRRQQEINMFNYGIYDSGH